MTSWSPEIYKKAWFFASVVHQGQTYGGPVEQMRIEYLNHLSSVAMEIISALQYSPESLDGNLAVQCAILHDVIEDTNTPYSTVLEKFGEQVANGVMALTKNKEMGTKDVQMQDSLKRIKQQPKEVWMVKMADRITNLYEPPYYWNNEKILAYQQEARLIYEALKDANEVLAKRLLEKIEGYTAFLK